MTGWVAHSFARFRHHANLDLTDSTADFANLPSVCSSVAFSTSRGFVPRTLIFLANLDRSVRNCGSCGWELPLRTICGHWELLHCLCHWLCDRPLHTLGQPFSQLAPCETLEGPPTWSQRLSDFLLDQSCTLLLPMCFCQTLRQTHRLNFRTRVPTTLGTLARGDVTRNNLMVNFSPSSRISKQTQSDGPRERSISLRT